MRKDNLFNSRIASCKPLPTPELVLSQLPLSEQGQATISAKRLAVAKAITGEQPHLLIVVGPCSIHNTDEALAYGRKLAALQLELADKPITLLMRAYFEKPRTRVGWKGFINDPDLNDSFDVEKGIRQARQLLLTLTEMGLGLATEALDPIVPQYLGDLISWAAIGARTTESQTHREMASGLSMPVGFKNATDGSVQIAIDAMVSAAHPHRFLGIDEQGQVAVLQTQGNQDTHLILRGGVEPNFDEHSVSTASDKLRQLGLSPKVMVDCSHANSNKDHTKQPSIALSVAKRRQLGEHAILGLMIESNLEAGNQPCAEPHLLKPGVSITDACIDWATTEQLIRELASL